VILLFLFGVVLIVVEIAVLPGHILPGLLGAIAIMISLIWAMLDKIPNAPMIPDVTALTFPMANLAGAMVGAGILVMVLARWLPKTKGPLGKLILTKSLSESDGYVTSKDRAHWVGAKGVALTTLRPSGTAKFGEEVMDVVTEGEFVSAKDEIMVKEVRGAQIIVRKIVPSP
jgi:membrane-bound serine protease (ClpP class)